MIDIKLVENIAKEFLKDTELFIVELTINETNVISISLDSMQNVSIGDCISLSKHIENNLDRETEDFELMVSSAGVGQALKLEKQYVKNIGRLVEIVDKEGLKHSGILKEVEADTIGVEITRKVKLEGEKRKKMITTIEQFELAQTKSVVVIPEIGKFKKK